MLTYASFQVILIAMLESDSLCFTATSSTVAGGGDGTVPEAENEVVIGAAATDEPILLSSDSEFESEYVLYYHSLGDISYIDNSSCSLCVLCDFDDKFIFMTIRYQSCVHSAY